MILELELVSKKNKVWKALNYFEPFLIFISSANDCVSISVFATLAGIPVCSTFT